MSKGKVVKHSNLANTDVYSEESLSLGESSDLDALPILLIPVSKPLNVSN